MKTYYDHAGIQIYLGDCREILPQLPDKSVDLVLTDPPYRMAFRSNYRVMRHDSIVGDERLPVEEIAVAIQLAGRAAYVFCRWDNLSQMPPSKSVLAWVKNNWSMGDLMHEHGRQWEAICFYAMEGHEFEKRIPDVIYADRTGNELHPTQKPVELFKQLIKCNKGQTILDPFSGSGTTAIACHDLKRDFICIEKEPKYVELSRQRLEDARAQLQLF